MGREVRQTRSEAWRRPPTAHVAQFRVPVNETRFNFNANSGAQHRNHDNNKFCFIFLIKKFLRQRICLQDGFESTQKQRNYVIHVLFQVNDRIFPRNR